MERNKPTLSIYLAGVILGFIVIVILCFGVRDAYQKQQQKEKLLLIQKENPYINLTPFKEYSWPQMKPFPNIRISHFKVVKESDLFLQDMTKMAIKKIKTKHQSNPESNIVYNVQTIIIPVYPEEHLSFQIKLSINDKIIKEGMFVAPHPNTEGSSTWLDYWYNELLNLLLIPKKALLQRDPFNEEGKGVL